MDICNQSDMELLQPSTSAKLLATILVKTIRYGLALYWIPMLSIIGLVGFGDLLTSGSIQWNHYGWTWFTMIAFFLMSWFAAGMVFITPTVLRNAKYCKILICLLLLPFFVIPTYFKHQSEWFDDAVSEVGTLWHTISFWSLMGYYGVFYGVIGFFSPHFSSKQDWLVWSLVVMLVGYFAHLVTLCLFMRGRSWLAYFWLLFTHILFMTIMNLVVIAVTAALFFMQDKSIRYGELDVVYSFAIVPAAFCFAALLLDFGYIITRLFRCIWRYTKSLFCLITK